MSISEPISPETIRLFHEDPYLCRFDARVLACVEVTGGYSVVLDRTAFYATAGGQPHDLGTLGGAAVMDVADDSGVVKHRVSGPLDGEVSGHVEWPRRFDHMQQHTGQHVLSQAFIATCAAETVSFHLGMERVTIDLNRTDLGDGNMAAAEARANEIVQQDREVRIHWTTLDEIGRFPLRKPPKVEGRIRVVEIDSFDFSACGGTHVARTGEIGLIKVLRREKYKSGTRVEFLCGGRALADYAWKHELLKRKAEQFSIQDRDLGDSIDRLLEELNSSRRKLREFEEARLESEAVVLAGAAAPLGTHRLVQAVRDGGGSADDLKFLALRLRVRPGLVALLGGVTPDGRGHLVFARSDDAPGDMAAAMKAALAVVDGKGGGRPEMAQGSGPAADRLEAALEAARRTLVVEGA